jgi:hypothetical protein
MVERQVAIGDELKSLYGTGLGTSIPCAPELMRHVITVNQQRAEAANATTATSGRTQCKLIPVFAILQQIHQFSPEQWALEVASAQSSSERGDRRPHARTVANTQPDIWDWRLMGQVYQAAVALYCISSLIIPEMALNRSAATLERSRPIELVKESCCRTLLEGLKAVASTRVSQLRKFVLWPLVIAGIVVRGEVAEEHTFILDELMHVSRALGTASALVARDLISRLWARRRSMVSNGYSEEGPWDELFDRSYCFAV